VIAAEHCATGASTFPFGLLLEEVRIADTRLVSRTLPRRFRPAVFAAPYAAARAVDRSDCNGDGRWPTLGVDLRRVPLDRHELHWAQIFSDHPLRILIALTL
jgi:hypothetical protein